MSTSVIRRSVLSLLYTKGSSSIPAALFNINLQSSTTSISPQSRFNLLGSSRLFLSSASASKDEVKPNLNPAKDSETKAGQEKGSETGLEKELKQELAKINIELSNARTKCDELEDKYKRSLADSENLRARLTKQINDQKLYAIQSFCKDLTDIEDILHLAVESVTKDQLKENKHLATLYEGVKMTEARLLHVFEQHGLKQLNPLNAKFNPNEHEAVLQKEEPGKESGTVILVSKLGYKLYERVIRPAVVGVAK